MVEAVEQVLPEVDDSAEDVADSLDLEEGTPQALAIMLGKVAVVSARTRGCGTQVRRILVSHTIAVRCIMESKEAPWHVDRPFRACAMSNQEGADL